MKTRDLFDEQLERQRARLAQKVETAPRGMKRAWEQRLVDHTTEMLARENAAARAERRAA